MDDLGILVAVLCSSLAGLGLLCGLLAYLSTLRVPAPIPLPEPVVVVESRLVMLRVTPRLRSNLAMSRLEIIQRDCRQWGLVSVLTVLHYVLYIAIMVEYSPNEKYIKAGLQTWTTEGIIAWIVFAILGSVAPIVLILYWGNLNQRQARTKTSRCELARRDISIVLDLTVLIGVVYYSTVSALCYYHFSGIAGQGVSDFEMSLWIVSFIVVYLLPVVIGLYLVSVESRHGASNV